MARAISSMVPGETRETIRRPLISCWISSRSAPCSTFWISSRHGALRGLQARCNVTDDTWLERVEDIMYFETDPNLSMDLNPGIRPKAPESFYRNLPGFVEALDLIADREFYPLHADFFSRRHDFRPGRLCAH